MKKKLLFVIPALNLGGAEKSFVNLLNAIDYNRYEVDVFLMTRTGVFLDFIPKEVNILPQSQHFSDFSTSFSQSVLKFLKEGQISLVFYKILFTFSSRLIKNPVIKEQKMWKYLKYFLKNTISLFLILKKLQVIMSLKKRMQRKKWAGFIPIWKHWELILI